MGWAQLELSLKLSSLILKFAQKDLFELGLILILNARLRLNLAQS